MPEIRRCAGKRDDGKPFERVIGATSTYCYSHDPEAAKTRKEASMIATAARGSTSARLKGLDKKLASLERDLREGLIDRGTAAVLNQILNTRARLVELNLRAIEQQEILDRLDEIEEYQARNKPMYRGASI
jgi:hypothetical protein